MEADMRRMLLSLIVLVMSCQVAVAQTTDPDVMVAKPIRNLARYRSGFSTAAANTVWYGFLASSTDPNKVGVGGKWDFDTPYDAGDITGTDSTQFWKFVQAPEASDGTFKFLTTVSRPQWYYDYGNDIDNGDHNLTVNRLAGGRITRMQGLAGVWHQDNLTTVPDTGRVSPGFATNITGSGSAWCGLRLSGDAASPIDSYTGNAYTSDQEYMDFRGPMSPRSGWPGYAGQWDQLLYRDFAYNAGTPGTIQFDYRAELSSSGDGDPGTFPNNGGGWFTPDPFSSANLVHQTATQPEPVDSFEVWVGAPKESGVYDSAHRYLSDTIDFGVGGPSAPAMVFATTGVVSGNSGVIPLPAGASWSSVRVVFRVKTNRFFDDARPSGSPTPTGFNSTTGACVIDNVNVNGNVSDFESASQIKPRFTRAGSAFTENSPSSSWITTGRSPAYYGHIHNMNDLPFADPCGKLFCNLSENIIVQSNHDPDGANPAHTFRAESQNWAISPTMVLHDLSGRAAAQGSSPTIRTDAVGTDLQFDYYSGFDDAGLSGVFFFYALRTTYDPVLATSSEKQLEGPTVTTWTAFTTAGNIIDFGAPVCQTLDSSPADLNAFIDIAHADSVQLGLENQARCARFSATACGQTDGSYWDNIRMGFILGGVAKPSVSTSFWFLLGDTFPFNESISPGSTAFDTVTALVKDGLNNAKTGGGEGVIPGDSVVYTSPFSGNDTRMDLVFRIKPGPGNYSVKGNRGSPLWKIPSDPGLGTATGGDNSFWGQYMKQTAEKNGEVGSSPDGHTATVWDPQTWNSARMDSAQATNLYPVQFKSIGNVTSDTWQSTYIESDPKGGAQGSGGLPAPLAQPVNFCYVISPGGPVNNSNICCDAASCAAHSTTYPPPGYPAGTTTYEGTKILPDGLFTPGTHIQYFVRRSAASNPSAILSMSPDTTTVTPQTGMGFYIDQLRYDHVDVLPDMWKDTRFGGNGLACILYVDAADRRGGEPAVVGALDSLGYGVDNGAERGWKAIASDPSNPNDPSGFVPANLGAMGVAYDKFDIRASESGEGDRLGCRIVGGGIDAGVSDRQCKQGPTVAMLDHYYDTIIWDSEDLDESAGAMHDGSGIAQEQSDDAGIINQWLDAATAGDEKAFWGNGDGLTQDLANSNGTSCGILLARMGGLYQQDNYFDFTGNHNTTAIFKPLDADPGAPDPFHSGFRYGIFNSCLSKLDVIDRDGGVPGAERAARYEDISDRGFGGIGPYYSSVYRRFDAGAGRFYATLLDGFSFDNLRGWGGLSDLTSSGAGVIAANDYGRRQWMQDALNTFNQCARVLYTIDAGDVPGLSINFVRGAFPNPAVPGAAKVRFSLAQPAKVTIRFYDVAGRLVHEATVDGRVGADNVYRWDGTTASGAKAASGVYFYRLSSPGLQFQNNSQRMVLLGQSQ
jgi:hypothetical protein